MDLKILMRENHIFKEIMNYMDAAVQMIDREGIVMFYNKAAADMDGIEPEEVLGRHILEVYPSLNPVTSSMLKILETKNPVVNQQQTVVNHKGRAITMLYSTYPLYYEGSVVGACDISRDITKVRELSERVLDLQAELLKKKTVVADKTFKENTGAPYVLNDIMGQDPKMVQLKVLAQRVAQSTSPILIYGETGTGKELLVQAIHNAGVHSRGPFVAQNCAALPASLLESIFFGTVRGSFTGAGDRQGLFELAHDGTLFFDEVNSLPVELQGKLLRVLQEGAMRRVGDHRLRKVNVRVVASTNIDPQVALKQKMLRQDLYYRLNVVSIVIPPLRERRRDIPLLVNHFIQMYNARFKLDVLGISNRVEYVFTNYTWPGNVRELQHCIEHAMNIVDGQLIEEEHLPPHMEKALYGPPSELEQVLNLQEGLSEAIKEVERKVILETLENNRWNVSRTASQLKLPRQTLQYKMKVYHLENPLSY